MHVTLSPTDGGGNSPVRVGCEGKTVFTLGSKYGDIQSGLPDIKHEPAYRDETAKLMVLCALQKIASKAKVNA
jgi:hypothetical protein